MNLTNFLKQTDLLTERYTKEQLREFIHDIARALPERNRDVFLEQLQELDPNSEKGKKRSKEYFPGISETDYAAVIKDFDKIEAGEVFISSEYNEEYDDWYGGEEFFYEDPEDIGGTLQRACRMIHTCMDTEQYKKGLEMGKRFFSLSIDCYSEYGDEVFSVRDMVRQGFLQCDLTKVALDTLYCGYHAVPCKDRPETLYEIIMSAKEDNLSLEAVMQHGDEELPEFSEFLREWTEYLGTKTGGAADHLFVEAAELCNDRQMAEKYAKKFATEHPGLYLKLLEHADGAASERLVKLGEEALGQVPKKYVIRGRVALKTAEILLENGSDSKAVKECYFNAFLSDTTVVNYLRCVLNGMDHEDERKELHRILETTSIDRGSTWKYEWYRDGIDDERKKNNPGGNIVLSLKFLDGQFEDVLSSGLNIKEALGWTGTFMKPGIAMFLLAMYDGAWSRQGIQEMADLTRRAFDFSPEQYRFGLGESDGAGADHDENELFYDIFEHWKRLTPMQQPVKDKAIKKIEALLEKRTAGIMEASRRNYYGECAAYIAALGEVKESLGEKEAKQKLMTAYKEKYTRRSAFRAEMKSFGWLG